MKYELTRDRGLGGVGIWALGYDEGVDELWNLLDRQFAIDENLDTDADGLPDWWEFKYFGGITNAVASADVDQDRANNLQECIAGTVPTNAASVFVLSGGNNSPLETIISWPSVSSRVYHVLWCTNLLSEFGILASNITATPSQNVYTDTVHSGFSPIYYGVKVER